VAELTISQACHKTTMKSPDGGRFNAQNGSTGEKLGSKNEIVDERYGKSIS